MLKIILILVALLGIGIFFFSQKNDAPKSPEQPITNNQPGKSIKLGEELWSETGVVIPGGYADADVVDLGNGKFRMYYSAEPGTKDFQGQVYSAISSDGIKWTTEEGTRITLATFPSVIKLSDESYRMYFQENREIKSAISTNGLTWKREDGVRIDAKNTAGLTLTGVLAPTVMKIKEEYVMVYAGAINQPYEKEKVPNKETHPLLWATSKDGLTFEKKGIALDSRNETFKGWMDGPELITWDDSTIKLFFWGYFGVYESIFEKGSFSEPKFVFYGPNFDSSKALPPSPSGDPTLVKIGNTWNLYYGYFQKGIYRAILK
ncbi:MAG: hypothetical protein Q8Q91_02830 [Candidatus Daviesbacteria bacterium]|nr:hypothetical protein [Candidatus Daviesbacteria bacterium]